MERRIRQRTKSGLTLTELLVVVSIIVLVTGVMVPLMKPVFEGQETREAARNISVFFANAKTRAIQKNRPVGVWLERASSQLIDPTFPISDNNPSNPNNNIPAERAFASYRMFIAEQPESYTGDTQDAEMALRMDAILPALLPGTRDNVVEFDLNNNGNIDGNERFQQGMFRVAIQDINQNQTFAFNPLLDGDDLVPVFGFANSVTSGGALRLVRAGDYIQFNGRGGWYRIARHAVAWPNVNNPFAVIFVMYVPYSQANSLVKKFANGTSYKVLRQPRRSSDQPLQLPDGVAVDLSLSGLGNVRHFRYPDQDRIYQQDAFGRGTVSVDNNGDGSVDARYYNFDYASAIPNESDLIADQNFEIVIMFNTDGTFDHVYYVNRWIKDDIYSVQSLGGGGNDPSFFAESIKRTTFDAAYLMIGLDEKVGRDRNNQPNANLKDPSLASTLPTNYSDNLGEANLLDTTNIWLMVKHEQIGTAQNAAIPSFYTDPSDPRYFSPTMNPPTDGIPLTNFSRALRDSRQLIQSGQNLGGR